MYLVSRTDTFAKLFFLVSFSGLVMYIVLAFYTFHTAYITITRAEMIKTDVSTPDFDSEEVESELKYILQWTQRTSGSRVTTEGRDIFFNNSCSYTNCYLTSNKNLLKNDVSKFNAIIFGIHTLYWRTKDDMPAKRSPKQKYIFLSMAPAERFPVCNIKADEFFNWTWSYKLSSNIVTPYIEVTDVNDTVVAPKYEKGSTSAVSVDSTLEAETRYHKHTIDVSTGVGNKSRALMWYVTDCDISPQARHFVRQLQSQLERFSLAFDIYGCNYQKCPEEGCFKELVKNYYFYLALEDSMSEDYVTTEVLNAYDHNVVPVVVGGARYNKFLPYDSYINAGNQPVKHVAAIIRYVISTPVAYKYYFSWKKNFKIRKVDIHRGLCDLCAKLNDKKQMESSVSEKFRAWWYNGSLKAKCLPKGAERIKDLFSYMQTKIGMNTSNPTGTTIF